jgi:hypothetical protein
MVPCPFQDLAPTQSLQDMTGLHYLFDNLIYPQISFLNSQITSSMVRQYGLQHLITIASR